MIPQYEYDLIGLIKYLFLDDVLSGVTTTLYVTIVRNIVTAIVSIIFFFFKYKRFLEYSASKNPIF